MGINNINEYRRAAFDLAGDREVVIDIRRLPSAPTRSVERDSSKEMYIQHRVQNDQAPRDRVD